MVKSAIRSRQLAAARNRMMADVPHADVVLVNPTHVAVALRYEAERGAPRVVARGAGAIATAIRERAATHGSRWCVTSRSPGRSTARPGSARRSRRSCSPRSPRCWRSSSARRTRGQPVASTAARATRPSSRRAPVAGRRRRNPSDAARRRPIGTPTPGRSRRPRHGGHPRARPREATGGRPSAPEATDPARCPGRHRADRGDARGAAAGDGARPADRLEHHRRAAGAAGRDVRAPAAGLRGVPGRGAGDDALPAGAQRQRDPAGAAATATPAR